MRRWPLTLLIGAIVGTLLDQLHVQGDVLTYGHGAIFAGQAWWVPLEFGIATVLLLFSTRHHLRAWRVHRSDHPVRAIVVDGAWFLGAYVLTATLGDRYVWAVAAALGAIWLLRIALRPRPLDLVLFSLGLGLFGTAWESVLTSTGEFTYVHPTGFGVPAWLPFLYMMGAPAAVSLVATLDRRPVLSPRQSEVPAPTASRREAMLDSSSS